MTLLFLDHHADTTTPDVCNVKQTPYCVGYINGIDVGYTLRCSVSFRREENEPACISVCECMCWCACDVFRTVRQNETRCCHLAARGRPGGHTVKHVLWEGG